MKKSIFSILIVGLCSQFSFCANFRVLNGLNISPSDATNEVSISGNGLIVTGRCSNGNFALWENGQITTIDHISNAPISLPCGISQDGSTVVGYSVSSYQAFQWDGTISNLSGISQNISSYAMDVSADGSVIVGRTYSNSINEGFRWENGSVIKLGDLIGGSQYSNANAVSADGSIIVGKSVSSRGIEAYRWENGVMTGLGDFAGGTYSSEAFDISADGTVIVGAGQPSSNTYQAAYWKNGTLSNLGDLPGGDVYSLATAVSGDGSVVVGRSSTDNGYEAFIWTEQTGMRNLRKFLENKHGLDLTGWQLTNAFDISDDGYTIVGGGYDPTGNAAGWIVTIPEPCTLALLSLGMLMLRRRPKENDQ